MNNVDDQKLHKYCLRCGRKLKTENARILGYGPICAKKINLSHSNRLFEADMLYLSGRNENGRE